MNAQRMLTLQQLDTTLDQLAHRLRTLPERAARDAAHAQLAEWRARADELSRQAAELESRITDAEAAAATLTAQRSKLEQQLKTVIAPREAEALMHEIATVNTRRDALDDQELEALGTLGEIDAEQAAHAGQQAALQQAQDAADSAAATAEAELAARRDELSAERAAVAATIEASDLARYDALRAQLGGVAVATLNGRACSGCHLDLSAVELEAVRDAPADEMPECPQCGRLLAR